MYNKKSYIPNYIVFEGPDYIGKTSTMDAFERHLIETDILPEECIVRVQSPGTTDFGMHIRKLTEDHYFDDHYSKFLCYLAGQIDIHFKVVKPALEEGLTVLQDRCELSTLIYQCSLGTVDEHLALRLMKESGLFDLKKHVFHLTISENSYIRRSEENYKDDPIFDQFTENQKIYLLNKYKFAASQLDEKYYNYKIMTVDTSGTIQDLAEICCNIILKEANNSPDYWFQHNYT